MTIEIIPDFNSEDMILPLVADDYIILEGLTNDSKTWECDGVIARHKLSHTPVFIPYPDSPILDAQDLYAIGEIILRCCI